MRDTERSQKLTRTNAAVLLVDHQVGLIVGSRYPDPETLLRNTLGLARAARILDVPIIATTTMEALFGPLVPELRDVVGDAHIIERSKIDPFDDPHVVNAIAATGRRQLITAGVYVSVCASLPSVSAAERGYRSYVAIDACAAIDAFERDTAVLRMTNAGVIVNGYGPLVVEMLADNADPKAWLTYEAIRSQYGVATLAAVRSPAAARSRG